MTDDPTADVEGSAPVNDLCALFDADFLNDAFEDVPSTFGGALDFDDPTQTWPAGYCQWPEAGGGQALDIRVEDAATVDTDDHSGRAYNLDQEPIVEPQDGPGSKAVVLKDNAFGDEGGEPLTYGYFFVEGDAAVFISTTGFDAGPEALRTVADEVDAQILAG